LSSRQGGVAQTEIRAKTNRVRIGDPATRTRIRKLSESNLCADRRTGVQDCRFVAARSFPSHLEANPRFARLAKRQGSDACRIFERGAGLSPGCRNLSFRGGTLLRSGTWAKGPGTNGARIGDAALRSIRASESNGNLGRRLHPSQFMVGKALNSDDDGAISIHHRGLQDADHGGVRGLLA